jgi:hypothetical protein
VRPLLRYWVVAVKGAQMVGGSSFNVVTLGDVFLSPTTKLSGQAKCAMLDSERLAIEFAQALESLISKRQGTPIRLVVSQCEVGGSSVTQARDRAKIGAHSAEVRARLKQGQFAPNRKVLA